MTREKIRQKQIEEAVSTSITETLMSAPNYEFSPRATDLLECAFWKGAEWADENPASPWHKVADGDLPKESKGDLFNLTLLVRMSNGRVFPAYYDIKDNIFADEFNEVIKIAYWMEIPELPTELE